jgi:uncharacterized iron-regulated membrane protein
VFYGTQYGLYAVIFFNPGEEHGSGGMRKMLFVDGKTGTLEGSRVPWEGTAADVFMQLQFPLHSGRIAGLPGRILLSFMGLVVALLSLTGIIIWLKKRAARAGRALRGEPEPRTSWIGAMAARLQAKSASVLSSARSELTQD